MDIGSKRGYPAGALSNFSPHPFELDGVKCASMEGFLQGVKFKNPLMQEHVCSLVGITAKRAGSRKMWKRTRKLWWRGESYDRDGDEYQELLDRAYEAMAGNKKFRRALIASGRATLTHAIGRIKKKETVLTRQEFCSRLTKIRERIRNES